MIKHKRLLITGGTGTFGNMALVNAIPGSVYSRTDTWEDKFKYDIWYVDN